MLGLKPCLAHGDCIDIAPQAFQLDDVAHVIGTAPDALLLDGAGACPSTAIRIIDQDTREQVYPWRPTPEHSMRRRSS